VAGVLAVVILVAAAAARAVAVAETVARAAVAPTQGQVVALGSTVAGECLVQDGQQEGRQAYWELSTVIPAFVHGGEGGVVLSPPAEALPRPDDMPADDPFGKKYVLEPKLVASPKSGGGCTVESFDPLRAVTVEQPGPYVFVQYDERVSFKLVPNEVDPPTAQPCARNDPKSPFPSSGVSAPPDPGGDSAWYVVAFCNTTKVVGFYVKGTSSCPTRGNMSHWTGNPYINQYDAGARLKLPVRFGKRGGNACGPSSLLMAMLQSAGPRSLPTLTKVFDATMTSRSAATAPEQENDFHTSPNAVAYLKSLGWKEARKVALGTKPEDMDQQILTALGKKQPIVISTAFGTNQWGVTGGGHMIAIVGADQRGNFIVEDPAGDFFASQKKGNYSAGGHYGPGSCGHRAVYPHFWLLAYTTGRQMLELGPRTRSRPRTAASSLDVRFGAAITRPSALTGGTTPQFGSAIAISDTHPGKADAPRSFYLQDPSGRRAGWIDGRVVEEIPNAAVGQDIPSWTAPAAGDPSFDRSPHAPPATPHSLVVPNPTPGTKLHVSAAAGGRFALTAEAWRDGSVIARDALKGTGAGAAVVASPALAALSSRG